MTGEFEKQTNTVVFLFYACHLNRSPLNICCAFYYYGLPGSLCVSVLCSSIVHDLQCNFYFSGQKNFSKAGNDTVTRLQSQVNEVKGVMTQNIEKVMERGDRLDDLMDKTEELEASVSVDCWQALLIVRANVGCWHALLIIRHSHSAVRTVGKHF